MGPSGLARVLVAALALLSLVGCGEAAPVAASDQPMEGTELAEALRGGGYVVFLRHATSDSSVDQGAPPDVGCGRQRNLSREGREESERIGEAVEQLGIPVGEVLASPYCRTMDTAELAFGEAEEEYGLLNGDDEEAAERLAELLSEPPERGNTWLVGHVSNIGAAADLDIDEGEAAVFAPAADDGFTLVATVPVDGWEELREAP